MNARGSDDERIDLDQHRSGDIVIITPSLFSILGILTTIITTVVATLALTK